jgi:myo-inositol 2-dehydrogenase/D-chiro-inositol 1-dehydrogenase
MRVGMVGAVRIGEIHFANLRRHPAVADVRVFDPDQERVAALSSTHCVSAAPDLDAVFDGVDAIVISSPTPTHVDLLDRAISADLPAFCEKPVSTELADIQQLAERADQRSVGVQVGFHYRFDPVLQELSNRVQTSGGRPSMRVHSTTEFAPPQHYLTNAGGLVADKLIHELDLVRWFTGTEITTIAALGARSTEKEPGEPLAAGLLLQLSDGGVVSIWGGYRSVAGFDVTVEVETPKAVLVAGNRRPVANGVAAVPPSKIVDFRERFADAYEAELTAFLDFVQGRRTNPCDLQEAARTQLVVTAAQRALRDGLVTSVGKP